MQLPHSAYRAEWYAERRHLKRTDFLEITKERQGVLKPPVEKP